MADATFKQSSKCKLLIFIVLFPWVSGCSKAVQTDAADDPQKRFDDVSTVLVVDAVAGTELEYVKIYNDRGIEIYSSGIVSRRVRGVMALGGTYIPLAVRAVWRKGAGWDKIKRVWNEGVITGDYTIPVAKRIPDQVLNDIRTHGGNLRLKFRLKPDGILFGWDIERAAPLGNVSIFATPGGDFLETRY
jgi:hypothetical protein